MKSIFRAPSNGVIITLDKLLLFSLQLNLPLWRNSATARPCPTAFLWQQKHGSGRWNTPGLKSVLLCG